MMSFLSTDYYSYLNKYIQLR